MSRYIITDKDTIIRTDSYLVKVECENGNVFTDLEPRRLFPITDLNRYITLLDEKEKEIALIKEMSSLNEESAKAVNGCFEDFYMIPKILSVVDISDKFGVLKWTVITDRGEISFSIRNRHSDIKVLYDGRVLIRDNNDNRYEIENLAELDKRSRSLLSSEL